MIARECPGFLPDSFRVSTATVENTDKHGAQSELNKLERTRPPHVKVVDINPSKKVQS